MCALTIHSAEQQNEFSERFTNDICAYCSPRGNDEIDIADDGDNHVK